MAEEKERKPRSRERGLGRNNKGRTAKTLSFSCSEEAAEAIKSLARNSGMTFSGWVIKKLLS